MTSWYSNIVGATTSKISNLQRSLLSSEADGDTEDDTHVCRVLRSYYTEKGQAFPAWLPPDPKGPPPVAPVYSQQSQVGARYGGLAQQPQAGSLSSLWDNNPASQTQEVQSLRRGRGNPAPMRSNDPRKSPFRDSDPMAGPRRDDVQARPLPSQQSGSYQNSSPFGRDAGSAPPGGASGSSAQDRLKQRLWGGSRTTSPSGGGPFNPPPQNDRPYMGANSPWSSNEQDYSRGGGGRAGGGLGRPGGLPSGPRMR
ncbi:hypothetical protein DL764_005827 [Monosporascus ibericus]|uniref:Mso1 N-terminal domain-containing protein n=1 Tax=Monosporascus ibericus TaxID=155417 RepID=A0A4Q4T7N5_9PEZI|nr:hypothetical protein DL764_005827 [Monosporascus ibericus]